MKKLLLMSLTLSMLLTTGSVSFASDSTDKKDFIEAGTVYVGVESQPFSLSATPTPSGALPARATDVSGNKQMDITDNDISLQATTWKYLPGYQVYNQTTSYNCGPASVQAALRYINGSAPKQSDVASGVNTTTNGTYLSDMVSYINGKQSSNKYVAKYKQTSSAMKNALYSGVATFDAAPIVGMAFSSSDGWLYSSGGHFMSVYGAKSDKSSFALADPWIGYSGSGLSDNSWSYSKSASTIYNAYSNVNIGYMY